jgi:uncharacterized protein YkwD
MAALGPQLNVEPLEGRDCPAVNFLNGVLTITGTGNAETLIATQSSGTITAQGQSFSAPSVTRVVITALGGNDVIRNNTAKPATLFGGTGNDTIHGGSAGDRIFGGHGADSLFGNAGADVLFGGGGTDALKGGGGKNALSQASPNSLRSNTAIEAEIIRLVNVERAAAGLAPLTVNLRLNTAAGLHTTDMVRLSNLYGPSVAHQHTLYGTSRPMVPDRLDAAGYDTWSTGFSYGENIAYGFGSAASVMSAWMNSSGHRANILSTSFREIGVAVAADAQGRLYFTQVFGYQA